MLSGARDARWTAWAWMQPWPPKSLFSTYDVRAPFRLHGLSPGGGALLYLGGAEAAAVTVVWRADGEHAHQPLLSPPAGLPWPRLLLGLPRRQTGWLIQERSPRMLSGFLPRHLPLLHPLSLLPAWVCLLPARDPRLATRCTALGLGSGMSFLGEGIRRRGNRFPAKAHWIRIPSCTGCTKLSA